MKRELLLLRHGKSNWNVIVDDFQRPLKKRGKRNATRMGQWMLDHKLIPDQIITSPAIRAKGTAEKVCEAMGISESIIRMDMKIYEADLIDLLEVLQACPVDCQRLLLIGHNPGLDELLLFLVKRLEIPADGKLLPTATLAHLEFEGEWSNLDKSRLSLRSITRPKSLS